MTKKTPVRILIFHMLLLTALPAFSPTALKAQGARGGSDIRRVDFQNFTYRPSCAYDGRPVRTRKGSYVRDRGDDKLWLEVQKTAYGDLTGDRRDEAVVVTKCNTGGTGHFTEGFIYTMRKGRVSEIARLEEGDRAFGGIHDVRVERGLLVEERYAPVEPGTGACCPEYIVTTTYRLTGSGLVQVGKTKTRKFEGH